MEGIDAKLLLGILTWKWMVDYSRKEGTLTFESAVDMLFDYSRLKSLITLMMR